MNVISITESWKKHPTYHVAVSNLGRVLNLRTGNLLAGFLSGGASAGRGRNEHRENTYRRIPMGAEYDVKNPSVHSLVLETFVGPRPEGYEVDHINRDRTDNRAENLRWVTQEQNRSNRASRKTATLTVR